MEINLTEIIRHAETVRKWLGILALVVTIVGIVTFHAVYDRGSVPNGHVWLLGF